MSPVPAEPLWAIFTSEVVQKLRRVRSPTALLDFRLKVLAAGGLNSHSYPGQALRAYKAAWDVYLLAGFACGLFEGAHGNELRARLTGAGDGGRHFARAAAHGRADHAAAHRAQAIR